MSYDPGDPIATLTNRTTPGPEYDPIVVRTHADRRSRNPLRRLRAWWSERQAKARLQRARRGLATAEELRHALFGNRAQRRHAQFAKKPAELAMRAERTATRIRERKAARGYRREHVYAREQALIARMTPPATFSDRSVERFLGRVRWWGPTRWIAELMRSVAR